MVVSYSLIIKNIGGVADTFRVTVHGKDRYEPYFSADLRPPGYGHNEPIYFFDIQPQEQISVIVWVYAPINSTNKLSDTVTVTVAGEYGVSNTLDLTTWLASFQEEGGLSVIEAEHVAQNIDRSNRNWMPQGELTGYVGSGYMSALPDTDLRFTPDYTASPELIYTINFTTTGIYNIWLRGYTPNAAGDSIYVGLDDQPAKTLTGFVSRGWNWANRDGQGGVTTIEITEPGLHTLHLWQREDGLRLDRILLIADEGYTPTGNGPPESESK